MKLNFQIITILSIVFLLSNCETKTADSHVSNESITVENTDEEKLDLAPNFILKDIDGKTVKLADFKGSYVYIDIWATWCGPCIQQIPFMKEMEEKYHDSNIKFVSVSVDADKDKQKWENFVHQRQMTGLQLFAGKNTPFSADYQATSIPKFVLLGKSGEILNENAPRPMGVSRDETGKPVAGLNQELMIEFDRLLAEEKS